MRDFMNNFELFSLIFLSLDAQWDNNPNEALGDFLSDANPFLWTDICSADPAYYDDFCNFTDKHIVELNDSYKIAKVYIEKLGISEVAEAFMKTDEAQWFKAAKKYLSAPHKGEDLNV